MLSGIKSGYAKKAYRFLITIIFLAAISLIRVFTGCKYDVAGPQWDQPFDLGPIPKITQIEPEDVAAPGVNYITIHGENFIDVPNNNGVYFDNMQGTVVSAEVVEKSQTVIKVRRPDIVASSCFVKVAPGGTIVSAKDTYRVDRVFEQYGSFLDNLQLAVATVDVDENLYVVEYSSKVVYKVTPGGDKTNLGTVNRAPTEVRLGPDGNLYFLGNDRRIDKLDVTTAEVTQWTRLPQGKVVKFGDFYNGYLYTGQNSGLFIVSFDNPENVTETGFYGGEEILAVRSFENYLYVVSREGAQPAKIWKHQLQAGTLGAQELVFDMSTADSVFSFRLIKSITFSSDGIMFIATDDNNPLLTFDPASAKVDFFYKEILPPYCKYFYWGYENYLYMIIGNDNPAENWTVYRVDLGTTSVH